MSRLFLSSRSAINRIGLSAAKSLSLAPQRSFSLNLVRNTRLTPSSSQLSINRSLYVGVQYQSADEEKSKNILDRASKYSYPSLDVPFTFIIVPDIDENAKDLNLDHYRLHFFCPITRKIVRSGPESKGFKIHLSNEELSQYIPYIQFGYYILKLLPLSAMKNDTDIVKSLYEKDEDDIVIIDYAGNKFKPFESECVSKTEIYEKYVDDFLAKIKATTDLNHQYISAFIKENIFHHNMNSSEVGLHLFEEVWASEEGIAQILAAKNTH